MTPRHIPEKRSPDVRVTYLKVSLNHITGRNRAKLAVWLFQMFGFFMDCLRTRLEQLPSRPGFEPIIALIRSCYKMTFVICF